MDNIIINLDDGLTLGNGGLPNLSEQTDIISQSDAMVGPAGPAGPAGKDGKDGQAATITVGTTTTGAAGTNAQVQNSGTSSAAVLDFTIPRGERGETGATGATGATGPAGADGADGEAATITVGSVQTVAPEYPATVTNSGTTSAAILDFEIPRGLTGETGPAGQDGQDGQDGADGQAATITVGTTTTGAAGTNASVTNSGTSSAAVFNFTIPRGDTGATGADGFSPAATVTQNTGSATISITDKNGTTTATVYDGTTPSISSIIDAIYPVGSIYMSATLSTVSQVQTAFGGTWVAWGSGRVPVGVDTNQTEFNSVEKTGGEKTHTLTVNEMPKHTHGVITYESGGSNFYGFSYQRYGSPNTQFCSSAGNDEAHNNLQPYITCYMYKRTA